ncbi:hypothetical protein [Paludisphaera soli]|uniref:hypothetical protein n=1 Tax=Paludisphaera soli TaxID=2712865 RepID=UPI0013EB6912|nr:hypothetical protein [Paludisphaera soli]
MPKPRRRTLAWLMLLVASASLPLALFAHLRGWERRRQLMYHQADVTRAILDEAHEDIAAAGRKESLFLVLGGDHARTAEWDVRLEAWERRDGEDRPLIRARVSGSNGRLASALAPIRVETYGSPLDPAWLDRLTRAYRKRGWRFELVRDPTGPDVRELLDRHGRR